MAQQQVAEATILLEQERQRAEQERQRAEQERLARERLEAYLQSQGIDPDQLSDLE